MTGRRYKKSYKTRRKKSIFDIFKIFKYKVVWIILLVLFLLGGLTYLLVFSSVFQIKNIQISKIEKAPIEEIRGFISDNTGNIFTSDLKSVGQNILRKYPQIASIDIRRRLPDKVIVQIQERQPLITFCTSSLISTLKIFKPKEQGSFDCFYLDKEGVVFEKTDEDITGIPIIKTDNPVGNLRLGKKIINEEYLKKILDIILELKDIQISEIRPLSKNRLDIKTFEGWEVYFNAREDINPQVEELQIILKEKLPFKERENLEYIDLRFEKIYIYPENR